MRRDFRAGTVGRLVGAGLSSLLLAGALVVVPTPAPAEAVVTAINIGDAVGGDFTFFSFGDVSFGNSETEGTIAVGGTADFVNGYPIRHTTHYTPTGYSLPTIDGDPTRLFANRLAWGWPGQLDVSSQNAPTAGQYGFLKLGVGEPYSWSLRSGQPLWVMKPGSTPESFPSVYVAPAANQAATDVNVTKAFSEYFAADQLTAILYHDKLASHSVEDAVVKTLQLASDAGSRVLTLTANKVNFIELDASNWGTYNIQWGGSVRPSESTPIVFNVRVTNGGGLCSDW